MIKNYLWICAFYSSLFSPSCTPPYNIVYNHYIPNKSNRIIALNTTFAPWNY